MPPDCKICRAPNRRRLIEADWADGVSAVGIAATMVDAGWPITSQTILKHLKEHAGPGAASRQPPDLPKRDAAIFFRDRIMDAIEEAEKTPKLRAVKNSEGGWDTEEVPFDILDKDLQGAIGTALKAESIIQKREAGPGAKVGLFVLMLGGADGKHMLAPLSLASGEDIFEGEAVEVPDADE